MGRGKGGIGPWGREWERRGEEGGGGKEDGGEKEGLPPLEWRSGYTPAPLPQNRGFASPTENCNLTFRANDVDRGIICMEG